MIEACKTFGDLAEPFNIAWQLGSGGSFEFVYHLPPRPIVHDGGRSAESRQLPARGFSYCSCCLPGSGGCATSPRATGARVTPGNMALVQYTTLQHKSSRGLDGSRRGGGCNRAHACRRAPSAPCDGRYTRTVFGAVSYGYRRSPRPQGRPLPGKSTLVVVVVGLRGRAVRKRCV